MVENCKNLAVVFPGQGAQSVGMLQEFAENSVVNATFHTASTILGYDLWQLVQEGPAEQLNQTAFTQPAILAADVALWYLCRDRLPCQPHFMAGHSLGEYSALVCAEALDFTSAISLVAERGRLMQQAVPSGTGGMAAIVGLDDDKVIGLCKTVAAGQIIAPANYNSIGQTVIAGELPAVERAVAEAKTHGAKLAKLLQVSVPSHCELMKKASEDLAQLLKDVAIRKPVVPVVNNVDVACYDEPQEIKAALIRQLYMPVRWVETVQFLANNGVDAIIESGPGKILAGLNKRIVKDIPTVSCMALLG